VRLLVDATNRPGWRRQGPEREVAEPVAAKVAAANAPTGRVASTKRLPHGKRITYDRSRKGFWLRRQQVFSRTLRFDDLVFEHLDFHRENLEFVVGLLTDRKPENFDQVPAQVALRVISELELRRPLRNGLRPSGSMRVLRFQQFGTALGVVDRAVLSRIRKVSDTMGLPPENLVWAGIMLYPEIPWSRGHVCSRFRRMKLLKFMAGESG